MTVVALTRDEDRLAARRRAAAALALAAALSLLASALQRVEAPAYPAAELGPGLLHAITHAPGSAVHVIVREVRPATDAAESLVRDLGGVVDRELPLIRSFSARIDAGELPGLVRSPSIDAVWGDARLHVSATGTTTYDSWSPNTVWRQSIRLGQIEDTYTGAGVTVAVLDTGVARVQDVGNRVLARVDLTPGHDGDDRYGHGTHLAGIIVGDGSASNGQWRGVAPGANLVSVKVAGADGSTDVSVVIAGLQWVFTHRAQYGIRVLNLAFGTDSQQSYGIDPLNYAVEQVWLGGVLVVVSAGNRGPDAGTVNKPGDDPFVLTVGAADLKGTIDRSDDVVAPFSSWGTTPDGVSKPDLVAPGITIVSARDVGSTIDQLHPDARVGDYYFKGTGTSQATAIVAGVAALMYQADPTLSPDAAKATLTGTAYKSATYRTGGGSGLVDAAGAVLAARQGKYRLSPANLGVVPSTGAGSIEASRGSFHVYADPDGDGVPQPIQGEIDVLGLPWTGPSWSATSWGSSVWSTLTCENAGWSATSWSGTSWSGTSWSATSWGSTSWGSTSWGSTSWGSTSWSATSWSSDAWS